MLLSTALVTLAAAAPVPATCHEPPPCVYVTPDPALVRSPGTVYVYRGRGWPRRTRISAQYGSYCPPTADACFGVGNGISFRTDDKGRFIFRLRYGRTLPTSIPRPAGAGSEQESIRFHLFTRDRELEIDAQPPPPPSTPEQRAEAMTLVAAARRAAERLYPKDEENIPGGTLEYEREIERCRRDWNRFDDKSPRGRIIDKLLGLALDESMLAPILPRLHPFADELERLPLADPALRRGADAWIWDIRRPRAWPKPSLCTVIRKWKATGYDLERAPIDPRTAGATPTDPPPRDIGLAAKRLRQLGVGRDNAALFADLIDFTTLVLDDEI